MLSFFSMTIRCRKVLEEEEREEKKVNYGQGGAAAKVATLIRQTRKVGAFIYLTFTSLTPLRQVFVFIFKSRTER